MNLQSIGDQDLLQKTESLALEERRIGADLLRHLRELDRRRLYLKLGYDSLYHYCVKHLKLSEGAAARRIASMRYIRELPDAEGTLKSLEQGEVNLSTLCATQRFIQSEKKHHGKTHSPQALLEQIQGRSQKECDALFAKLSPEPIPEEKERILTETQTEVRFVMTTGLKAKLEEIRCLLSHQVPDPSYAELIEKMAEIVLKQIDPRRKVRAPQPVAPRANAAKVPTPSRYIPAQVRRAVWKRDHAQCTYTHPKSKRRCSSRFQLELDHITPVAHGGRSTINNLRLQCRSHNIYAAIEVLGPRQMQPYLRHRP